MEDLTPGERIWLCIRKSISKEQLKTVVPMLISLGKLELTEKDIEKVCNTDDSVSYSDQTQLRKLINPKTGAEEEVSFEQFLILYRIYNGTKIYIDFDKNNRIVTKHSFNYDGKRYTAKQVSDLLNSLFRYFYFDMIISDYNPENIKSYVTLTNKARDIVRRIAQDRLYEGE